MPPPMLGKRANNTMRTILSLPVRLVLLVLTVLLALVIAAMYACLAINEVILHERTRTSRNGRTQHRWSRSALDWPNSDWSTLPAEATSDGPGRPVAAGATARPTPPRG